MNSFIKGLIIFAVGAASGAAASYVVCTKKYQEEYSKGMTALTQKYRTKYATLSRRIDEAEEERKVLVKPKKPVVADMSKEALSEYKKEPVDYAKVEKIDIKEEPKEVAYDLEKGIEYISAETYYEPRSDYEKEELNYFVADEKLVSADDEEIEYSIAATIGSGFRDHWGEFDGDDDCLYVRNRRAGTDYLVIHQDCSSGITEDSVNGE